MLSLDKKYILIFVPFICFFFGYLLCNLIIGSKTYQTPNLTGLSIYDAVKLTSPHQINIRILSEKERSDIPEGTILSQKPSAGRLIKTHQPVFVVTTKSPPEIKAPLFVKESLSTIEKMCHDNRLKCKTHVIEYPSPVNSCIAQIPHAGETVLDKKINIYVAQNRQDLYLMPDLTNQPLSMVIDLLKEQQSKIVVYQGSTKLTPPYKDSYKVITQKPLAGSLISLEKPCNIQLQVAV